MQVSRLSVKAHKGSGPIGSSFGTGFQFYLSNCWDPNVSPIFWNFLPCSCMLILSLLLLGLVFKSSSLIPGFCIHRPKQYNTICLKLDLISKFFAFFGSFFERMESINVASVLQEAGDADSRASTLSKV